MAHKLRPETIETLARFAEKAGLLAAALIRQYPADAVLQAFELFHTVMSSCPHAVDIGGQLRDSKAYYAFDYAWRIALKEAMADLVSDDHQSPN